MIEADRADHSRAKLDHDLIVPITTPNDSHLHKPYSKPRNWARANWASPGLDRVGLGLVVSP